MPVDATQFGTTIADGTKLFSLYPRPRTPGKIRKVPLPDQLLAEQSEIDKDRLKQEKKAKKERARVEKGREKQEKLAAKEKEKEKKAKDVQDRGRASSSAEDEDKKKGFMRFRLKSRERKAAENGPAPAPEDTVPSLPMIRKEPAMLPIADKFSRDVEDVSSSEPPRDSQSSNGFDVDSYPRARVRGLRYERPHPAWRTSFTPGPSSRGLDKEEPETVLPPEVHAYPPGHIPEDRSRRPSQANVDEDEESQEVEPSVDPEIIRQYYGLPPPTPVPVETDGPERSSSPTFAELTPAAQKSLQQALKLTTTDLSPKGSSSRPSPTKAAPSHLSPYIVPSPDLSQHAFNALTSSKQPITPATKRGGIQFVAPPPINVELLPPRRANDPNNPPPTPPPTTGLPPTPPEAGVRLLSPNGPARAPSPRSPGRANSPYGRAGVVLSPRATSPTLRPLNPLMRASSPVLRPSSPLRPPGSAGGSRRGKASPFPTRPMVKPIGMGNYLLNRRVDASGPVVPRATEVTFTDTRGFDGRHSEEHEDLVVRVHAGLEDPQHATLAPPSRREARRNRDGYRRSTGYESDGADTESRHSLDTFYSRNTHNSREGDAQFSFLGEKEREEALRQMPVSAGAMRRAALGEIEFEREQGRERLVRLLVGQGTDNRI